MTQQNNFGYFSHVGKYSSKSNTLKYLKKRIKKSRIEKIFDFTVLDWKKNQNNIINEIYQNFPNSTIIIRSSAIGEDSVEKSKAGMYTSIPNVDSSSKDSIKIAINNVIHSYRNNGNFEQKNQILVQTQISNVKISGVVFTRTPDLGAPYIVINYEEGISTDGVTRGRVGNTIKIFRKTKLNKIELKWRNLIQSLKELENYLSTELLDVEFAITRNNNIVIFQARPITSIKFLIDPEITDIVLNLILKNKRRLKSIKNKKLLGKTTIFSDMCDWNPAEIIGNNPKCLDYSIYDYLFMKNVWYKSRILLGYQKIKPTNLMVKFGNKPYVDVRASFNSLLPELIPKILKKKLMKFYLDKLIKNPYLHDKVEFEILFTCYDFEIDKRLNELRSEFSKKEISLLKKLLTNFTKDTINNFPEIFDDHQKQISKMCKTYSEINFKINNSKKDYVTLLTGAEHLLKNCKKLGTLPFSSMARLAFIATAILRSLEHSEKIKSSDIDSFMNSIYSPLSEIQYDYSSYVKKIISRKEFLQKYGHLRPGTYDITALRYDQQSRLFDNLGHFHNVKKIKLNNESIKFEKILKNSNFELKISFDKFSRKSIMMREKIKFEFTKGLSDALELIIIAVKQLGITKEEVAFLDLQTIFKNKNLKKNELKKMLKRKIKLNSQIFKANCYLVLPPILFSDTDFEIIKYGLVHPNFISKKMIIAEAVNIRSSDRHIPVLQNKIAVVENADPGFDWILSKNPAGLITKYGGVASHMAIRCAELNIPAAIGCGEVLFEKSVHSKKLLLDCDNKQIIALEPTITSKYADEKKILKALGYIK